MVIQSIFIAIGIASTIVAAIYVVNLLIAYIEQFKESMNKIDILDKANTYNESKICELYEKLSTLENKNEQLSAFLKDYTDEDPNEFHTCKNCAYGMYRSISDYDLDKKYCMEKHCFVQDAF